MKILKNNWLIILLSLLTNICILFAVNYAMGNIINGDLKPYNLSENFVEFNRSQQSSAQANEIINFNEYDNLIVIAEVGESGTVGLLDLQMKYYKEATKATAPTVYRYFSELDYLNQTKVGIIVNNCDFMNVEEVKASNIEYQLDEVINCIETEVWEYGSIYKVQNIYSVDFTEVTRVFVDSTELQEISSISNKLLEHGFINIDKNYNIPILKTVLDAFSGRKHEQFLVSASVSVLAIFIFMAFIFFQKYKKHVKVSRIVGGNFKTMMKFTLISVGMISLMLSCIAYLVLLYFEGIGSNYLSLMNFFKIQGVMLLCNSILAIVNLSIIYKNAENLTRRS
ncbi:hypothetical protein M3210_15235 [Oceanobacillus luteolus]|nr:hypothetical protein [Oceanobacillus luteolus]